jgi:hypothetical protein
MSETARLIVGIALLAIALISSFRALVGLRGTSSAGFRRVEPILGRLGVRLLPSDTPYWIVSILFSVVLFLAGLAMVVSIIV